MSIQGSVLADTIKSFKETQKISQAAIQELVCLYANDKHVITPSDLRKILECKNLIKDDKVHPAAAHIIEICRIEDGGGVIWLPPIGPELEEESI